MNMGNLGLISVVGLLAVSPARMEALLAQQRAIAAMCKADSFSGAVLVAAKGRPVWAYGCGYSDRENKIAMMVDTPMRIASMGKMFTIISVLQLSEAGQLELDAPLRRYLPDYPNADAAAKITIRELLMHTAGTGDIFGLEGYQHRHELRALLDYERTFGNRPLRFEPGSKLEYSNFGYILLGLVIQSVSGESYYDYVQRHIFKAAGMQATFHPVEEELKEPPSNGYTRTSFGPGGPRSDGPLTKVGPDELPYRATSAGGCFSTVGDLNRFAQALITGRLISPAMLRRITVGEGQLGIFSFGFGRGIDKLGRTWIGFAGGAPGNSSNIAIYPNEDLVIVALSNFDPGVAEKVVDDLEAVVK